jgi:hypothetical protein
METFDCTVTYTYKKVKFTPSGENNGRCLKCAASDFCGAYFHCPCNIDEQLKFERRNVHEDLVD